MPLFCFTIAASPALMLPLPKTLARNVTLLRRFESRRSTPWRAACADLRSATH